MRGPRRMTARRRDVARAVAHRGSRGRKRPHSHLRVTDASQSLIRSVSLPLGNRQTFDRLHARPLAPFDLRVVDRELQAWPAPEQSLERARSFNARQLMAKAEMNSGAESDMPVWLALEIELLRMDIGVRIEVRGRQHRHDPVTLLQLDTAELDILSYIARLGELHRRDETQKLLDRQAGAVPVLLQPVAQASVFQELMDRAADQMGGRLVPREKKQEDHRHHLIATDLSALFLHAHELGDETLTTMPAHGFEIILQIAPHREHIGDHGEETHWSRDARDVACPGGEFRPIGKRETEEVADHRQPPLACVK